MPLVPSDNPYAFPLPSSADNKPGYGMSLRDYFAAAALSTVIHTMPAHLQASQQTVATIADHAYNIADEMLKRRKR